jgi:hypothetical protein
MTAEENVKGMNEGILPPAFSDAAATEPAAIDPSRPVPDQFDLVCEWCGYSLVGLTNDRCPECGERFNPGALPLARIPWLFRRNQGVLPAYLRTVWMILRRPTAFAREISRPVRICAEDARGFRAFTIQLTIVVASLGALTGITCLLLTRTFSLFNWREFTQVTWTLAACVVALWLFLWLATDLPTFIWRGLPAAPQDLTPLHHYACAPLAFAPLVLVGSTGFGVLWYVAGPPLLAFEGAVQVAFFSALALLPLLWWIPIRLMRGATGCSIARQLGLGVYLPFHWGLIFFGTIILIGVLTMPVH